MAFVNINTDGDERTGGPGRNQNYSSLVKMRIYNILSGYDTLSKVRKI